MRARRTLLLVGLLTACSGPDAPDAAVCEDLIHRLCVDPLCPSVADRFGVAADCEAVLSANTGCGDPAFAFTSPSRSRVLECRLPLLSAGADRDTHPDCYDVDAILANCGDVAQFLGGGAP